MKVLVACEYSGTVRDAFTALGHDAMSCDLEPTDTPGKHYQGDVMDVLGAGWDLMIAHPPCTYICNSSSKHLYIAKKKDNGRDLVRWAQMQDGAEFFKVLWNADIPRIAVENPIMLSYAKEIIGASQTQVVQPWMFGQGFTKATCLWLKNLPALQPTNVVSGRVAEVHLMPPSHDRGKKRSKTYQGIADAMAAQWGGPVAVELPKAA